MASHKHKMMVEYDHWFNKGALTFRCKICGARYILPKNHVRKLYREMLNKPRTTWRNS